MTRIALCLLLPLALQGCGGDDETPAEPPVPPNLTLAGFGTVDGTNFDVDADCIEIGTDADQSLLVRLKGTGVTSIGDWSLRPPGTCGSNAACGHLQVRVDPINDGTYALQATGATTTLTLPFARPCPQTASETECVGIDDPTGDHTIEVILRDDDGVAVAEADGSPVRVTADVTLALPGGC